MVVLERLHKEHDFPLQLFAAIKKNLKYNSAEDIRG